MQGEVRAFDDTDGLRKKFEQTQSVRERNK
jgi:hypothetical protein